MLISRSFKLYIVRCELWLSRGSLSLVCKVTKYAVDQPVCIIINFIITLNINTLANATSYAIGV